jgi:outer membrane PBP1 activator LpoA protein
MRIRSLKGLGASAAIVMFAGCGTPCGAPGRLCAPIVANTSAPTGPAAPAPPLPAARTTPVAAPPSDMEETRAGSGPGGLPVIRIGLLLPLRSDTLGAPAEAVRAGFMAAFERDGAGFAVNLVESGETAPEALLAYAGASRANDLVVGPLARSAVAALAASELVTKPTIALNHPDGRATSESARAPQLLVMGLSIEDEAQQVANWASAEHPGGTALIVSGASAWQHRIAAAFGAHWKLLGFPSQVVELAASDGYLNEAGLADLRARIGNAPPALLFTALDAEQLRQLRAALGAALGTALPCYGTSSVNPGTRPGQALAELDGVRVLDLPWEVQPDHGAVMVYPRWSGAGAGGALDLDRLYALGIDAFRVAREIALTPAGRFELDGVTGRLSISFGLGPASFERIEPAVVYRAGAFTPVERGR